LIISQFDEKLEASIRTRFAERDLVINYQNLGGLDFGDYVIHRVLINGVQVGEVEPNTVCIIPRERITSLDPVQVHQISVILKGKDK
jgi:hypothetical protein